jgi:MFS family permease
LKKFHYGWIIVVCAFFIFCTNSISIYGFGVFFTPLAEQFGWERGALSTSFSLGILAAGIMATFTGRLCDRYGPRMMAIISAVSMAVGFFLMSFVTELWQIYLIWTLLLSTGIGGTVIEVIQTDD